MKARQFVMLVAWLVCMIAMGNAEAGAVAWAQAARDLGTNMRLMCVAAHPDDEDGATLARYRYAYGHSTQAVIATRGEGGQNEIGPELYEALGVIRTREMQAAAAITGAELVFLDLPDFGYSKTIEETYAHWGREETLRRLVRAIRAFRPDVIITHHGLRKDHGHHQAIGQSLIEAFDAAADADAFPDLALPPWQATRLYIRTWEPDTDAVSVDIGALDPMRGETYAEIAARALGVHASQGMEYFIERLLMGVPVAEYLLVREAEPTWKGAVEAEGALFAGLDDRVRLIDRAFSRTLLDAGAPPLNVALLERIDQRLQDATQNVDSEVGENYRRWARLNQLAALAYGLRLDATAEDAIVTPGQTVDVTVRLDSFPGFGPGPWGVGFSLRPASWSAIETPTLSMIPLDSRMATTRLSCTVAPDQSPTLPHEDVLFTSKLEDPPVTARATLRRTDGLKIKLEAPVSFEIAAPVQLAFLDAPYLVRQGTDDRIFVDVVATNRMPGAHEAVLTVSPSPGLGLHPHTIPVSFASEDEARIISIPVDIHPRVYDRDYALTLQVAGTSETRHARVRVTDIAVLEGIRVGVIQSYDDTFVHTLERLGLAYDALTIRDFVDHRLDTYDAIIIDIRAYLVRPDLAANNEALLDYVYRGGTLLVMYHKTFEWEPRFAPYPIALSRNRVTQADAPVTLLDPHHRLFSTPNVIEEADWEGWAQERGLYFPDDWDDAYTSLIETADPGETIPPGAWLIAPHGTGHYVYTALSWQRQLKELHPGALRMFVNMLALGQ